MSDAEVTGIFGGTFDRLRGVEPGHYCDDGYMPANMPMRELDRRYFAYAAMLAHPLDTLAIDRRLIRPQLPAQPIGSLNEIHPLVTCIPWLFDEIFPDLSSTELLDLAEAGTLLLLGLFLQDQLIDGHVAPQPSVLLLRQQLYHDALRRFQCLFESDSPFWSQFDQYGRQCVAAHLEELQRRRYVSAYSPEEMYRIGSGKVALLKVIPTAMAIKAHADERIPQLANALDSLAAALQLADDLLDWEQDYARGYYTWPLAEALAAERQEHSQLMKDDISERFQHSVIIETLLQQTIEWFQQAIIVLADLRCTEWVAFVNYRLALIDHYRQAYIARKLLRTLGC